MTLFLDTHKGTDLPDDMRRAVQDRIRSGQKDEFGVIDRGVIIDKEAGQMHCILDAPDPNAVIEHHRALNVPLERASIHRVDAILK